MMTTFKFAREAGSGLNRFPNADEIAAMTPEQAEATLVAATSVLPLLVARAKETRPADAPEWITVGDAAALSGMSRFFFYDHWKELPFCRKIGRSVKLNHRGLRQWLETKKAA
ncbi:MAG: hypothetical protein WA721_21290 [Candidatus Binataceae bacterium]